MEESSTAVHSFWNLELCIFVFLFFSGGFKVLFIALVQSFSHYSNVAQKLVRIRHVYIFYPDVTRSNRIDTSIISIFSKSLLRKWQSNQEKHILEKCFDLDTNHFMLIFLFFTFIILVLYWAFYLHVHLATASQCLTQWLRGNYFLRS